MAGKKTGKGKKKGFSNSNASTSEGKTNSNNRGMSRADFIKTSGIAAAGVGAAALGMGGAVSAAGAGASCVEEPILEKDPHYTGPNPRTLLEGTADEVKIYRDCYGVPHIYSETHFGACVGTGYATAEDQLWYIEMLRRASKGKLSEVLGPGENNANLESDISIRTAYTYPDNEIMMQYGQLDAFSKTSLSGFSAGVNAFLAETATDPSRLPFEYFAVYAPKKTIEPWNPTDILQYAMLGLGINGCELHDQLGNLQFFGAVLGKFISECPPPDDPEYEVCIGQARANAMGLFSDVLWWDDPESPVSVPTTEGKAYWKQPFYSPPPTSPTSLLALKNGKMLAMPTKKLLQNLKKAGVPLEFGSYFMGIHQSRSIDHKPIFGGGPQLGLDQIPNQIMEAHICCQEFGVDLRGGLFTGTGVFLATRMNDSIFTMTNGYGANNDVFEETLTEQLGYLYNGNEFPLEPVGIVDMVPLQMDGDQLQYLDGTWKNCIPKPPLDSALIYQIGYMIGQMMPTPQPPIIPRYWIFEVAGQEPVIQPVLRTLHGPVIHISLDDGKAWTWRKTMFRKEYLSGKAFIHRQNATTIDEYRQAISQNSYSFNMPLIGFSDVLNSEGPTIAYFHAGEYPKRHPWPDPTLPYYGDPRFPLDGTGGAEWEGTTVELNEYGFPYATGGTVFPHIEFIDPSQGFFVNWNNKPEADFPYGCTTTSYWNKGHGVNRMHREVLKWLRMKGKIGACDMIDILKNSNESNENRADHAYFVLPHILYALNEVANPDLESAGAALEGWSQSAFDPSTAKICDDSKDPEWPYPPWPNSAEVWGYQNPGFVLFWKWMEQMDKKLFENRFFPGLPSVPGFAWLINRNTRWGRILHLLDYEFTGSSGVRPNLDYFDGLIDTTEGRLYGVCKLMAETLEEVMDLLAGEGIEEPWTSKMRPVLPLISPVVSAIIGELGYIGSVDMMTFGQVAAPGSGIFLNRLVAGQNSFFGMGIQPYGDPSLQLIPPILPGTPGYPDGFPGLYRSPHMLDQLCLAYRSEYKWVQMPQEDEWPA